MLNLFNPVSFNEEEKAFIDAILKPLGKDGWDDTTPVTKAIKHHISKHTIEAQGGRCAYCEKVLAKGDVEIEHIAPKKHYGEFIYEPYNLVSSCGCCNASVNKGQTKTIVDPVNKAAYEQNTFSIVHPYFDNPDDHIKYNDPERIYFNEDNCTEKGEATIKLFNWNEYWAIAKRFEIASTRNFPIDVLKLAAEIATYK